MSHLLTILKPHFFPHFSCFQYGTGGDELWLAKHCLQYVVVTHSIRNYIHLLDAKEQLDLPNLAPYLAPPEEYRDCILRFPHNTFDLILTHLAPLGSALVFPDIVAQLKPNGILVLPSGQMEESLVDYEKIEEGVYRKPNDKINIG